MSNKKIHKKEPNRKSGTKECNSYIAKFHTGIQYWTSSSSRRINGLKESKLSFEIAQSIKVKKRMREVQKVYGKYGTPSSESTHAIWNFQKEQRTRKGRDFKEMMTENFPNL